MPSFVGTSHPSSEPKGGTGSVLDGFPKRQGPVKNSGPDIPTAHPQASQAWRGMCAGCVRGCLSGGLCGGFGHHDL
jgi:hypothetical protein